jgi:hypothetical protein
MVARRRRRNEPAPLTIVDIIADPHLFAQHFKPGDAWEAWFVFLRALFALPMTAEQLAIYKQHTGRTTPPTEPVHEAHLICGRRARKSFMLATIGTYLACFKDWTPYLGPGDVGTVMIVCPDRKQGRVVKRYITGLLKGSPLLAQLIQGETRESITLTNRMVIEIHTASMRTTRGYLIVSALLDEVAYLPTDESASEPDVEVVNAIKPAMSTVPEAILLCASSPHSRRGILWDAYRRHWAQDGDPVLVWQASTRDMNPTVPQSLIDQALEEDPARASAEYLAQFRSDLEAFVSRESVEACISPDVRERPPLSSIRPVAFCDPSGGSHDSMTLAIAHYVPSSQTVVLDAVREFRPPFSPEHVVASFCDTLKSYNISRVFGDRYAGEWPREAFSRFGVHYEPSKLVKSDLYEAFLPLLNSKRVDLLDIPKLFNQLAGLERRVARGGHPSIDHAPGQHDDLANAVAGAAVLALSKGRYNLAAMADDVDADPKTIDD